MVCLDALERILGVSFNNISLLEQALIHSSYINENPSFTITSNERLEFLGDAILGLTVAAKLYQDFPYLNEGQMTKIRSALVQRDSLARISKAIGLGNYLYLGKGEEANGGRYKPINLAGAMEAVIAAISLDQGLTYAMDLTLRLLDVELQTTVSQDTTTDYKSALQELIQAREHQSPTYHLIKVVGPDHNQTFTIEARLADTVLGRGSGKSKKEAEYEAAFHAVEILRASFTQ
ncbi:ribonuclease III [Chloroflexota bacterium]